MSHLASANCTLCCTVEIGLSVTGKLWFGIQQRLSGIQSQNPYAKFHAKSQSPCHICNSTLPPTSHVSSTHQLTITIMIITITIIAIITIFSIFTIFTIFTIITITITIIIPIIITITMITVHAVITIISNIPIMSIGISISSFVVKTVIIILIISTFALLIFSVINSCSSI